MTNNQGVSANKAPQIEIFEDRKAWWAKVITPGRWKRILGPYLNSDQISQSVLQELEENEPPQ